MKLTNWPEKANFLEVAYLLIFGELPTQEQHDAFLIEIKEESYVDEDLKKILESFPKVPIQWVSIFTHKWSNCFQPKLS
ncbi:MAG: hypothetical protein CM15mP59_4980 [Flavobacteriaceae bacterium]|nr:MAG: hypothetical protein CM15mP59_4980 [Flavobacteriaceae bacterium]